MTSKTTSADRVADCVTEVRMGNTILTVSGYFKQDVAESAVDKMIKVLKAESAIITEGETDKGGG